MSGSASPISRGLGIATAVALTLFLLYLSRFWVWTAPWSSDGLFGLRIFSPYGNMVRFWLGGSWLQDFDIVVWGCGAFLLLTAIHWLAGRVAR